MYSVLVYYSIYQSKDCDPDPTITRKIELQGSFCEIRNQIRIRFLPDPGDPKRPNPDPQQWYTYIRYLYATNAQQTMYFFNTLLRTSIFRSGCRFKLIYVTVYTAVHLMYFFN